MATPFPLPEETCTITNKHIKNYLLLIYDKVENKNTKGVAYNEYFHLVQLLQKNEKHISFILKQVSSYITLLPNHRKEAGFHFFTVGFSVPSFTRYWNHTLSWMQNHLSSFTIPYLSNTFHNVVKNIYNNNSDEETERMYQVLYTFCFDNITSQNQLNMGYGLQCLSKWIEISRNTSDVHIILTETIFPYLINQEHIQSETVKNELYSWLLSIILTVETTYGMYAKDTVDLIKNDILNEDCTIRKQVLSIIYTLIFYCKRQVLPWDDRVIQLLKEIKTDRNKEVRESTVWIWQLSNEDDLLGGLNEEESKIIKNSNSNKCVINIRDNYERQRNKSKNKKKKGSTSCSFSTINFNRSNSVKSWHDTNTSWKYYNAGNNYNTYNGFNSNENMFLNWGKFNKSLKKNLKEELMRSKSHRSYFTLKKQKRSNAQWEDTDTMIEENISANFTPNSIRDNNKYRVDNVVFEISDNDNNNKSNNDINQRNNKIINLNKTDNTNLKEAKRKLRSSCSSKNNSNSNSNIKVMVYESKKPNIMSSIDNSKDNKNEFTNSTLTIHNNTINPVNYTKTNGNKDNNSVLIESLKSQIKWLSSQQLHWIDSISTIKTSSTSQIKSLKWNISLLENQIKELTTQLWSYKWSQNLPPQQPQIPLNNIQSLWDNPNPNPELIISSLPSITTTELKSVSPSTINELLNQIIIIWYQSQIASSNQKTILNFFKIAIITLKSDIKPITKKNLFLLFTGMISSNYPKVTNENDWIDINLMIELIK